MLKFGFSNELLGSAELESLGMSRGATHSRVHRTLTEASGTRLAQVVEARFNIGVTDSVGLQFLEFAHLLAMLHEGVFSNGATFLSVSLVVGALVSNRVAERH